VTTGLSPPPAPASAIAALHASAARVLHPDQIALCNEVFSPSRGGVRTGTRIRDAYCEATEGERLGAVMFEGEMIDEASRGMAAQVVVRGALAGSATGGRYAGPRRLRAKTNSHAHCDNVVVFNRVSICDHL
jgi:citrate lyase subunit beta/citryl-CoA lyase